MAGSAPENTLASIQKAAHLGISWVEFDVKLTCDHELVLIHDSYLNRTTNGNGPVAEHSLETLKKLDAGSWFGPEFIGETIPTLSQALNTAKKLGLNCNIELKPETGQERPIARKVSLIVSNFLRPPNVLVSSFCYETLCMVKNYMPTVPRALNIQKIPGNWQHLVEQAGCISLHIDQKALNSKQIETLRSNGIEVLAFTVNERQRAESLFAMGVSGIFTDTPEQFCSINQDFL